MIFVIFEADIRVYFSAWLSRGRQFGSSFRVFPSRPLSVGRSSWNREERHGERGNRDGNRGRGIGRNWSILLFSGNNRERNERRRLLVGRRKRDRICVRREWRGNGHEERMADTGNEMNVP